MSGIERTLKPPLGNNLTMGHIGTKLSPEIEISQIEVKFDFTHYFKLIEKRGYIQKSKPKCSHNLSLHYLGGIC